MPDLQKLSRALKIPFREIPLYREAMTHKSFAAEHQTGYDNQRLELLGDAVVQIVITRYLYDRYPELKEGMLTKLRSALANQDSLALLARGIDLGRYLELGHGEIELQGHDRDSTISDAFESLMGAIYLDQGLETARDFLIEQLGRHWPNPEVALETLNPKGSLQELTQSCGHGTPDYEILSVSGPDHMPRYEVSVSLRGRRLAVASASNRKLAERNAAQLALEVLEKEVGGDVSND